MGPLNCLLDMITLSCTRVKGGVNCWLARQTVKKKKRNTAGLERRRSTVSAQANIASDVSMIGN